MPSTCKIVLPFERELDFILFFFFEEVWKIIHFGINFGIILGTFLRRVSILFRDWILYAFLDVFFSIFGPKCEPKRCPFVVSFRTPDRLFSNPAFGPSAGAPPEWIGCHFWWPERRFCFHFDASRSTFHQNTSQYRYLTSPVRFQPLIKAKPRLVHGSADSRRDGNFFRDGKFQCPPILLFATQP